MNPETETQLTAEAKLAIQRYLLKLAVPSAAALSIISVAVGFGLNQIARDDAFTKAYSETSSKMTEIVAKSASAETQAELVAAALQKKNNELESLMDGLRKEKVDTDALLAGNFEKIAGILSSDERFRSALVKVSDAALRKVQDDVAALRTSLGTWNTSPPQTGPESRISDCPANTYAVGFAFQDESGLAHGALWTGHVVCRPLNLPAP